jgi:hypothetical protein
MAKKIRRGPGKRMADGKSFRFADEVRYIQRRVAEHDERVVSFGQIVMFSTESGDAWLLDTSDHLAARPPRLRIAKLNYRIWRPGTSPTSRR